MAGSACGFDGLNYAMRMEDALNARAQGAGSTWGFNGLNYAMRGLARWGASNGERLPGGAIVRCDRRHGQVFILVVAQISRRGARARCSGRRPARCVKLKVLSTQAEVGLEWSTIRLSVRLNELNYAMRSLCAKGADW